MCPALSGKCHRLLRDVPEELDLDHRGQLLRIVAAILTFEFKNAQPGRSQFIRIDGRMAGKDLDCGGIAQR